MGIITVKLPLSYVQSFTDDTDFVQLTLDVVEVRGSTVGECLNHLVKQFPDMKKQLFTKSGNLFDNIIISVNGESAYPEQLAKSVKDGDELNIVFMISGG
ncbi:MAG: MoaD/ThiS family protein [Candidatus Bathyarchaeota archaeon]|jgi:molybdopterin converting factor small subunit|nr:MoaD/ThiS family protein [Candidatus Bathyarchaeota archaeon]